MMYSNRRFQALLFLAAPLIFPNSARGQFTSVVEGTILDASGSAVPNASVTVTNQATEVTYRSTSNSLGVFRVIALPLGTYRAQVEASGFKPWTQTNLALEAGQVRTLNIHLELAGQQTMVEVIATAVAVETGKSGTGTEVAPTTIEHAPL